ncbi:hypothetical protein MNBD_ACTINO02-2209 [hydrothermal vent metagenome]|uniref:Uncharacterized protein n=1 Tax=hydrothermal vent metagenome TaxID=652676 RepID=A0A3B0RUZ0_9ZZZZ
MSRVPRMDGSAMMSNPGFLSPWRTKGSLTGYRRRSLFESRPHPSMAGMFLAEPHKN